MGLQPTNRYEKPRSGAGPRPAAPLRPPAALSTVTVGFRRCPTQCDSCSLTGPWQAHGVCQGAFVHLVHDSRCDRSLRRSRRARSLLPIANKDSTAPVARNGTGPRATVISGQPHAATHLPQRYSHDAQARRTQPVGELSRLASPKKASHRIQTTYWLSSAQNALELFPHPPAVIPTGLVKYPPLEPSHV